MKKIFCIVISIILMICLFVGCNMNPTSNQVVVEQSLDFNLANPLQSYYNPDVSLMTYDNKLYFCHSPMINTEYAGKISMFSDGNVETVVDLGEAFVLGSYGEYVYYFRDNASQEYYDDVYCYSLKTMEEKYLTTVRILKNNSVRWFEDGTICVPTNYDRDKNTEEIEYDVIIGDELKETIETAVTYQAGDKSYTIKGHNCGELYYLDGNDQINIKDKVQAGYKSLIPCNKGLLVHNLTSRELLYLIDHKTEEIKVLFEIQCMASVSTVNVYEDTVFLSFKRYEKWGGFPDRMLEYKDDTVQGTYRIDLNDGSAVKISDEIYDTLYIFGEGIIYATDDEGQIFTLDFDGNVIENLLT